MPPVPRWTLGRVPDRPLALPRRYSAEGANLIEGAFVSNIHVDEMRYRRSSGGRIWASHAGGPFDLSM
jgi:hypothetical protein